MDSSGRGGFSNSLRAKLKVIVAGDPRARVTISFKDFYKVDTREEIMRSRVSLAIVILIAVTVGACSRNIAVNKSSAGAVVADTSAVPTTRMLDRRSLNVSGFNHMADFIRPEVRERLDREPTGEDGLGQPSAVTDAPSESTEAESQEPYSEDNPSRELELEKAKFTWAKKKFGDALVADPTATGLIILYADEDFYDSGRLIHYVEAGRDLISSTAEIDSSRIQVIYGGYRGVAQVEMWIVPAGQNMPEPKPEEKGKDTAPEN